MDGQKQTCVFSVTNNSFVLLGTPGSFEKSIEDNWDPIRGNKGLRKCFLGLKTWDAAVQGSKVLHILTIRKPRFIKYLSYPTLNWT